MSELEILLNSPHKAEMFIILLAALLFFQSMVKLKDWFFKRFEIETVSTKREKNQIKSIQHLEEEVDVIKDDYDDIKKCMNDLRDNLDSMKDNLSTMQCRQDSCTRARIKDRIAQGYRYYNDPSRRCWNAMEKEAFNDLISSYEEAGGTNSFIHEIAQPTSLLWEVVD